MLSQASLFTAGFVSMVAAQVEWPVPPGQVGGFCDGLIRPDWDECEENWLQWYRDAQPVIVGPDLGDGVVLTGENCQLRYIQCSGSGSEFEIEEAGMYANVRETCASLNAGGVWRNGDLCAVVEDPNNPFILRLPDSKRDAINEDGSIEEDEMKVEVREVTAEVKTGRNHARDVVMEGDYINAQSSRRALETRQGGDQCSGSGTCYEYVEVTRAVNIRGNEYRVCNDVLPDGASCANSRAVTITQGYSTELNIGAALRDAINLGASFTSSYSEAITTTLTTTITIDCDGGPGYVVWYPLMERSSGQCYEGTCNNGWCQDTSVSVCSSDQPYVPADGSLSGEYDVQCI